MTICSFQGMFVTYWLNTQMIIIWNTCFSRVKRSYEYNEKKYTRLYRTVLRWEIQYFRTCWFYEKKKKRILWSNFNKGTMLDYNTIIVHQKLQLFRYNIIIFHSLSYTLPRLIGIWYSSTIYNMGPRPFFPPA